MRFGSSIVQGSKVSERNKVSVLSAVLSQRVDAKLQENGGLG